MTPKFLLPMLALRPARLGRHLACWLIGGLLGAAVQAAPALLSLEPEALALTQERLKADDPLLKAPFAVLRQRADQALRTKPRSVMDKTTVPPSGSKHDYMSMGPYWWPNPATANGLPYIQRDGQRNPESAGNALDAARLQAMVADVRDLALAFHFTGQADYARQAAAHIRTWFLEPATRMNPSLRFGQSVPGVAEGRGIGIIDTRDLWWVIDAVALIAPAPARDGLSGSEQDALKQWFRDYAGWLHSSQLGRDEAAAKNNHGMFFDVQLALYWLYTGAVDEARQLLSDAQTKRFAAQFDAQGRMPLELARTRPYHYHTFTLEAVTRMAHYSRVLSVQTKTPALNLWRYSEQGKSISAVLDFVAAPVGKPAVWRHATALEPEPPLATALPVLLQGQRALPSASYAPALKRLQELTPEHLAWLLWPVP